MEAVATRDFAETLTVTPDKYPEDNLHEIAEEEIQNEEAVAVESKKVLSDKVKGNMVESRTVIVTVPVDGAFRRKQDDNHTSLKVTALEREETNFCKVLSTQTLMPKPELPLRVAALELIHLLEGD